MAEAEREQEKRKHRRGAKHIWRPDSELTLAQAIYQREIGMWMHKHDMSYGQARRDLAFQAYRGDLRFYERLVARNENAGVPPYTGINISPDGGYAQALEKLGYRPVGADWNVGRSPDVVYATDADIAELLR